MYQRDPIINVKPNDKDGFTVITITGPDAEEYAQMMRNAIAQNKMLDELARDHQFDHGK